MFNTDTSVDEHLEAAYEAQSDSSYEPYGYGSDYADPDDYDDYDEEDDSDEEDEDDI